MLKSQGNLNIICTNQSLYADNLLFSDYKFNYLFKTNNYCKIQVGIIHVCSRCDFPVDESSSARLLDVI